MTFAKRTALAGALLLAAGIVAPFPLAPAMAQGINIMPEAPGRSPEQIERDRKIEEAYKARLRTIPDAQAADPWGGMRNNAPKPAARPAPRPGNRDVDWGALNRKP